MRVPETHTDIETTSADERRPTPPRFMVIEKRSLSESGQPGKPGQRG
jgi:hypothetical protein